MKKSADAPAASLADATLAAAFTAAAPSPAMAEELMQFGRFVGSWDLDVIYYDESGSVTRRTPGEWHFGWALEGRAVADVWIVPPRSQRPAGAPPPGEFGVTIRFYDPNIEAWRSTWHGPVNAIVKPFVAREIGGEMVLERTEDSGAIQHWVFGDITEARFRWRAEISSDDGRTWRLQQEMFASRVAAAAD